MHEGIYIAASAAFNQEKALSIIANNLANVNNSGFKRDGLVFKEMIPPFNPGSELDAVRDLLLPTHQSNATVSYVGATHFFTDYSQGPQRATGNPLDVAIEGDGFFVIQTGDGIRYTRMGNFRLDDEGNLATQDGGKVLDEDKNLIKLAPHQGEVAIDSAGNISVGPGLDNIKVGKLGVVRFTNNSQLEKAGDGMFVRVSENVKEFPVENASLRQGVLEASNVNAIEEMTRMISAMRAFETYQKVIQTIDSADDRAVNTIGRVA